MRGWRDKVMWAALGGAVILTAALWFSSADGEGPVTRTNVAVRMMNEAELARCRAIIDRQRAARKAREQTGCRHSGCRKRLIDP